ncbi:unnamed protein product [Strongylus vulgaris]|uniref:Uncharacterized protein n=1 Tax=Strongylus vulgaris TaxID=40348 RepID=A0A3P7L9Q0_STRVU|nr:unnamed protein product [Strongylus vulgaris]
MLIGRHIPALKRSSNGDEQRWVRYKGAYYQSNQFKLVPFNWDRVQDVGEEKDELLLMLSYDVIAVLD